MKNIIISEYYKFSKSLAFLGVFVLSCLICLLFFSNKINYPLKTFIGDLELSKEHNYLLMFYSMFFFIYSFFSNIVIVVSVLVLFYIDKSAKSLFYLFVSYQNLFKLLVTKLLFCISFFFILHMVVFCFSLVICKGVLYFKPDFNIPMDGPSVLLIFFVFLKMYLAMLGTIAIAWLIALLFKNFIIFVPISIILGSLVDFDFLPFNNASNGYKTLVAKRKIVFQADESSSIFNSLGFNSTDLNSLIWLFIVIVILWIVSLKFPSRIFIRNS